MDKIIIRGPEQNHTKTQTDNRITNHIILINRNGKEMVEAEALFEI